MLSFDELADILERRAERVKPALEFDLAKIGELATTMAAEYIGHEMPEWPPLAPSTVAQKEKLGYTGQVSGTDPLLRTGALRESIKPAVEGLTLVVGSTDKIAAYQEMGTSRIPPRPFLGLALRNSLKYAEERLIETAAKLLTPGAAE